MVLQIFFVSQYIFYNLENIFYLRHALTPSRTTVLARCGLGSSWTFILKKVMEVRRSTVAFRSSSFSGTLAGKWLLYIERSILRALCRLSSSLINFTFYNDNISLATVKCTYM